MLPVYILVMSLVYFLIKVLNNRRRHVKLGNCIPGPPAVSPIMALLIPFKSWEGSSLLRGRKKHINKYGRVIRYWFGNELFVSISDPKDVEVILSSVDYMEKSKLYKFLKPWLGDGLLVSSGEKWHRRRKIITPAFHFKILEENLNIFYKNADILVKQVEKEVERKVFDLHDYISRYTLDVICESAMGVEIMSQIDENSSYMVSTRRLSKKLYSWFLLPGITSYSWFFDIYKLQMNGLLKKVHGFTEEVIRKRRISLRKQEMVNFEETEVVTGEKKKKSFLDTLVTMSLIPGSPIKTDEDIREEVDTFMFEGEDTTSIAISATLFCLSKNQEVQNRVYNEIIDIMGTTDRDLTFMELGKLKQLENAIKESMRLYPSVPFISRFVKKDVVLPSGFIIPAGTGVEVNVFHLHRNPEIYPNPEEFDPDRFSFEKSRERPNYSYIPFSAGPRNCIGQKFAMLEMKASLSKVLCRYRLEDAGEEARVVPSPTIVFASASGFPVRISLRNKPPHIGDHSSLPAPQ